MMMILYNNYNNNYDNNNTNDTYCHNNSNNNFNNNNKEHQYLFWTAILFFIIYDLQMFDRWHGLFFFTSNEHFRRPRRNNLSNVRHFCQKMRLELFVDVDGQW